MLFIKNQDYGLCTRRFEGPKVRSCVCPEVPGPKLSLDCNRSWPTEVGAKALYEATSVRQFIWVGCTEVQSVAVACRCGNDILAGTPNYQARRCDADRSKTSARQSKTLIGYALAAPKRR